MGGKHSKGKISHDDLQYLLTNTKHSKEEIKVIFEISLIWKAFDHDHTSITWHYILGIKIF